MAPASPQGSAAEGDVQTQSHLTSGGHHCPKVAHFISDLFFCCQLLSLAPLTCLFQLVFSPPVHHLPELTGAITSISRVGITEGLSYSAAAAPGISTCPGSLLSSSDATWKAKHAKPVRV